MPEDYFDTYVPVDDYGFSKYICAKAIDGMEKVHELRLFAVFGPYEDWRVRFISNACCRAQWGLPIVIRQNVFFDYLDVQDLGRILGCCVKKELRHRHYNVCTGRAIDLATLAAKVVTASGKNLQITVKTHGLGNEYSGDNSRMLLEFPGFSFSNIDQSIARLYSWYGERKSDIDQSELSFDA
jgi:GDP-L-fucose synthase